MFFAVCSAFIRTDCMPYNCESEENSAIKMQCRSREFRDPHNFVGWFPRPNLAFAKTQRHPRKSHGMSFLCLATEISERLYDWASGQGLSTKSLVRLSLFGFGHRGKAHLNLIQKCKHMCWVATGPLSGVVGWLVGAFNQQMLRSQCFLVVIVHRSSTYLTRCS